MISTKNFKFTATRAGNFYTTLIQCYPEVYNSKWTLWDCDDVVFYNYMWKGETFIIPFL